MSEWQAYLQIGIRHILAWEGLDHILFILVLGNRYSLKHWKQLIWMVTAFTIGHSISLAVAALGYLSTSEYWVELAIPATIVISAFYNVANPRPAQSFSVIYMLTLVFGLIHGLGFGASLQALLGQDSNVVMPLLAFNIGLEIGQVVVLAVVLLLMPVLGLLAKGKSMAHIQVLNGVVAGMALQILIERL